mgnify:CR=1 FL=1
MVRKAEKERAMPSSELTCNPSLGLGANTGDGDAESAREDSAYADAHGAERPTNADRLHVLRSGPARRRLAHAVRVFSQVSLPCFAKVLCKGASEGNADPLAYFK